MRIIFEANNSTTAIWQAQLRPGITRQASGFSHSRRPYGDGRPRPSSRKGSTAASVWVGHSCPTRAECILYLRILDPTMERHLFSVCLSLVGFLAVGQQPRAKAIDASSLSASQRSAVTNAINRWNHQFKWRKQADFEDLVRNATIEIVHLGSPAEKDLIITDQAGCSPTGNCTILVLRPVKDEYRVVMEGIGQSYLIRATRTNGLNNLQLTMHGSATSSTLKVYKFNGVRYLRGSCFNEYSADFDASGKLQKLDKPKLTPCG